MNMKKKGNVSESVNYESEMQTKTHQGKRLKRKHFSNRSIHFESYITECFIEVVKLEPKRMPDVNRVVEVSRNVK